MESIGQFYYALRQLFYAKNVCKILKNRHVLNWTYGLFAHNYWAASISTFFVTLLYCISNQQTKFEIVGQF